MLLDYNFPLKYEPGSKIGQSDAFPDSSLQIKKHQRTVIAAISVEPEVISELVSTVRALPVTSEMIKEATAADPILQKVLNFHSGEIYAWTKNFNHFFSGDLPYLTPMGFYFLLNALLFQLNSKIIL